MSNDSSANATNPLNSLNDPSMSSWVQTAQGHPSFPIQNLPWGVFDPGDGDARIGVAIGDAVLDVRAAVQAKALELTGETACALCAGTLLG